MCLVLVGPTHAVQLQAAVQALADGQVHLVLPRIQAAETRLREAAPLFSLVATMQIAAFHTFCEFTAGASAIQSRNYKLVEALCRQPDPSRLDSTAYLPRPGTPSDAASFQRGHALPCHPGDTSQHLQDLVKRG